MYQFIVTYTCPDRDGFYKAIKEAGVPEACNAEPGCYRYEYFADMDDPNGMILLERWRSLEDQQEHMTLPHFAKIMELEKEYGAVAKIQIYEIKDVE